VKAFFDYLESRCKESNSLLCVGLDPHPELLSKPSPISAREYCIKIIEECAEYACAFKPNSAFFEAFGAEGIDALYEVIGSVPDGIPVILDAKRGDIASTAQAYARSIFDYLGVDAVTYSPYLGSDSIMPFVERPDSGVFVLCKTSNDGSNDLQSLKSNGEYLYMHVARQAQNWSQYNNLGLVVGATDPRAVEIVRQVAPTLWFLCPGVGMQGGDLAAAMQAGLREDSMGILINVSRSIASSTDPRKVAKELRDAINSERHLSDKKKQNYFTKGIGDGLLESGCVQFGEFTLKSGIQSPFYIDLRRLSSFPNVLRSVADVISSMLVDLEFNCIAAIPYAALPIGTAVALNTDASLIYPRREVKDYGTGAEIEGVFEAGDTAVVMDDLVTSGESKFETINILQAAGLLVRDVVVLIDREQGAEKTLASHGYKLHAVFTIRELLDEWKLSGSIKSEQYSAAMNYLSSPS
tara:strand:- start:1317 stop:2717 length:1401 start_codon:yes stop_codon:yes gene_type:complete